MPSAANILDVADRATGNAPVTDGLQVGDEGVCGRTYCAPKCEGREGYYRVSESLVMDVSGLKLQHPQHTADSVRHTVSARPDGRGTELRLTADGSTGGNEPSPADSQISTPRTLTCSVPGKDGALVERVTRVYNDAIWPELLAAYMVIFAPDFVTKGYEQ